MDGQGVCLPDLPASLNPLGLSQSELEQVLVSRNAEIASLKQELSIVKRKLGDSGTRDAILQMYIDSMKKLQDYERQVAKVCVLTREVASLKAQLRSAEYDSKELKKRNLLLLL